MQLTQKRDKMLCPYTYVHLALVCASINATWNQINSAIKYIAALRKFAMSVVFLYPLHWLRQIMHVQIEERLHPNAYLTLSINEPLV